MQDGMLVGIAILPWFINTFIINKYIGSVIISYMVAIAEFALLFLPMWYLLDPTLHIPIFEHDFKFLFFLVVIVFNYFSIIITHKFSLFFKNLTNAHHAG